MIGCLPHGGELAEVGVFAGGFSQEILQRVAPERLHLIDPWKFVGMRWEGDHCLEMSAQESAIYRDYLKSVDPDYDGGHPDQTFERLYNKVLRLAQANPCVRVHRGTAEEVLPGFRDASLDCLYLDANARYEATLSNLYLAERVVKPGGLIIGDDYFECHRDKESVYATIGAVTTFLKRTDFKLIALNSDRYANYVLASSLGSYAQDFIRNLLSSGLPIVELPDQIAAAYSHKFVGENVSVPSFGGTLLSGR